MTLARVTGLVPGDIVAVEGVVAEYLGEPPLGQVVVDFPFATDEAGLLDGVRVVTPHVSVVHCYHDNGKLNDYTATEGFYE